MQALKLWLNGDYIQHARFDEKGNFTLTFTGGGQKVYQVDDCTAGQVKDALELLKKKDAPYEIVGRLNFDTFQHPPETN